MENPFSSRLGPCFADAPASSGDEMKRILFLFLCSCDGLTHQVGEKGVVDFGFPSGDQDSITFATGETGTIVLGSAAGSGPYNGTEIVSATTSRPDVALVSFSGGVVVQAMAAGTANVSVRDANGNVVDSVEVGVADPASIRENDSGWSVMLAGHDATLSFSVLDSNGDVLLASNVIKAAGDSGVTQAAIKGTHYVRVHADADGGVTVSAAKASLRAAVNTIQLADMTAVTAQFLPLSDASKNSDGQYALGAIVTQVKAGTRAAVGDPCTWTSSPVGATVAVLGGGSGSLMDGPDEYDVPGSDAIVDLSEMLEEVFATENIDYTLACTVNGAVLAQVSVKAIQSAPGR
jgi:predicted RNA binding protein YcfA (HicA-like mRNA interferase family)